MPSLHQVLLPCRRFCPLPIQESREHLPPYQLVAKEVGAVRLPSSPDLSGSVTPIFGWDFLHVGYVLDELLVYMVGVHIQSQLLVCRCSADYEGPLIEGDIRPLRYATGRMRAC